tara:strand:+ start:8331 stop:9503 length:1173 start_codon:yes stop_codon:yes gene_type:complete
MTINIGDNDPRVSYAVAQGATQTSFAVPFEFFANADLNFYVDGTKKTITTHYSVSGGDGSTGTITTTSGNSVVGITGGSTVIITRSISQERTTDFPTSGPFNISSLNTELDRFIAITADLQDSVDRSLKLVDFDSQVDTQMPLLAARKGTVLGFNASTGVPEAGPNISDVQSLAAVTADIAALADIEDGTVATDAISGLAAIKANVTTVAGISSNVTTVAGNTTNINTVAGNNSNITTVAGISSNVTSVANVSSNVTTVAGISANVTTVSGISANVTTVAGVSSDVTTVSGISANVTSVANDATDIGTVATNIANVNTVGSISADVSEVAGISSNVSAVAGDATDIGNVAGSLANINLVASNINSGVLTAVNDYGSVTNAVVSTNDYGSV